MAFWKKRSKTDEKAPTESDEVADTATEADDAAAEDKPDEAADTATAADADASDKSDDSDVSDKADTEVEAEDATPAKAKDDKAEDSDDADEKDSPAAEKDEEDSDAKADSDDKDSDGKDSEDDAEDKDDEDELERSEEADQLWTTADVDPIEISLPSGTGYTLRHYRTVTDEDGEEAEEAVLLAHDKKLQLFRTAEDLIDYVKGDADHDLKDLDTWKDLVSSLKAEDVVPDDEDTYELDLVVQNLRGGHDVWDPDLLIGAAEITRDIGFACQLDDVLTALAPGSPLDDLDDALRADSFLARRRMRKINPERAAIAWRSLIGKVEAVIDWHGEAPEEPEEAEDAEDEDTDVVRAEESTDEDSDEKPALKKKSSKKDASDDADK